jgi:hypothetical protein
MSEDVGNVLLQQTDGIGATTGQLFLSRVKGVSSVSRSGQDWLGAEQRIRAPII